MNEFRIACPHCRRKIDFLEDKIGQAIHCPACGLKVTLDASAAKRITQKTAHRRFDYRSLAGVTLVAGLIIGCIVFALTHHSSSAPAKAASGSGTNGLLALEQMEKNVYMTNFAFTRMRIDRTDFGGVWGAAFSFGIKNNGDRPVTGVTVTLNLLDTNGTICRAEPFVAFSNQTNAPMLPGASWGSDPNNPYIVNGVPDSWQGGYDYAQVTDVQFLDSK